MVDRIIKRLCVMGSVMLFLTYLINHLCIFILFNFVYGHSGMRCAYIKYIIHSLSNIILTYKTIIIITDRLYLFMKSYSGHIMTNSWPNSHYSLFAWNDSSIICWFLSLSYLIVWGKWPYLGVIRSIWKGICDDPCSKVTLWGCHYSHHHF